MYCEEFNIQHRDIKPDNILIDKDGNYLLTDFGCAKQNNDLRSFTQTGAQVGTFYFMDPMSSEGKYDKADVWSLIVTLFKMYTNKLPFGDGTTPQQTTAILQYIEGTELGKSNVDIVLDKEEDQQFKDLVNRVLLGNDQYD